MNRRFFSVLRQYTIGESILLILAIVLDFLFYRIPAYLLRTKRAFDRYHALGYELKRDGQNTLVTTNGFTIALRRNSSDSIVFDQIYVEEELKPLVALIKEKGIKVEYIMDCGANIGLTSLYLYKALSPLKILALEPEPSNFEQLQNNIQLNGLSSITPVNKGVWSRPALMEHDKSFCNSKDWAFAVREAPQGKGSILVDTMDNIAQACNFSKVDYIKMDIEGSEFELFRNMNTWKKMFEQVKLISIEIHEKKGRSAEIEQCLIASDFKLMRTGELLIGYRT